MALYRALGNQGKRRKLTQQVCAIFGESPILRPMATVTEAQQERHFNGRLIAALTALSRAAGRSTNSRAEQSDVLLLAASLTGLAIFARSGRLTALGFSTEEIVARLDARFSPAV